MMNKEVEILEQVAQIIREYMPEEAVCCVSDAKFWSDGGGEGPSLDIRDKNGVTMRHPAEDKMDRFDYLFWYGDYSGRIRAFLERLRDEDLSANKPPRNKFHMTVHRDGSYEAEFIHDPELDARRLAELEEKERRRVEKAKEAWEALSDEEKAQVMAQEKEWEEQERREKALSEIFGRIYSEAETLSDAEAIRRVLEYLYEQAVFVAPEGWKEVEIVFREDNTRSTTTIDQYCRCDTCTLGSQIPR